MKETQQIETNYHKNAVKFLRLHRIGETWMFSDKYLDIVNEPFVSGSSEAIQEIIDSIPSLINKENPGISFSDKPMGKFHAKITRTLDRKDGSADYLLKIGESTMDLWLCSCLTRFFPEPPQEIYVLFQN